MPVVFGLPITSEVLAPSSVISPPVLGEETYGAHAMVAIGSLDGKILVRNSWGTEWGEGGYALMDAKWFSDGWTYDMWVPSGGVEIRVEPR